MAVGAELPATAAAAAATTAAATAAAEATAATAAAAATRALLRLVDVQRPAAQLAPVQLRDGLLGLLVGAHLDEGKAARAARLTVGDDLGVRDGAELPEGVAQLELG